MGAKRILVIDDEEDICTVTQVSLEMVGGWTVLTSHSGHAGLRTAKEEQPDAILLDVMMPDMDGPTTLQNLRADPATQAIPVLFLTAKTHPTDQHRFSELGVQGVITKPFDPLQLADQVAQVLGWSN